MANVSRFTSWILAAASGRSCLTASFNICTIMSAVANYVHYMIFWNLSTLVPNTWFGNSCRSSCSRPSLFSLYCTASCNIGNLLIQVQFLGSVHETAWLPQLLSDAWLPILDTDLSQEKSLCCRKGLTITSEVEKIFYPTQTHCPFSLCFSFLYLLLFLPLVPFSVSIFCSASPPTPLFAFFPPFFLLFLVFDFLCVCIFVCMCVRIWTPCDRSNIAYEIKS